MTHIVKQSWLDCIQNRATVHRAFPNHAAPDLRGLLLLRVVMYSYGFIKVVSRFEKIPPGASKQWGRRGYREVDVSVEVTDATVEQFSPQSLLAGPMHVNLNIQPQLLEVTSVSGDFLLVARGTTLRMNFAPDPIMQKSDDVQDGEGTDIEPR